MGMFSDLQTDRQLALKLFPRRKSTLAGFVVGRNAEAVSVLRRLSANDANHDPLIYLHGVRGCGKSHLLQAVCHESAAAPGEVMYLPMRDLLAAEPAVLDGLESGRLVAVDDVDAVAGHTDWEIAVFKLFDAARAVGVRLIFAAGAAPAAIAWTLPDLASRLGWGLVLRVLPLADEQLPAMLRRQAGERRLELSESVIDYMLARLPRDAASLAASLETLDAKSLSHGRALTKAFVREALGL